MSINFFTIAARALIFIFIFVCGAAPSVAAKPHHAKPHKATAKPQQNTQLKDIESSLNDLKKRPAITDAQAAYLNQLVDKIEIEKLQNMPTQLDIDKTNKNMINDEKKLSDSQLTLSSQYFSIFTSLLVIVLTVVSLLSVAVGYIIKGIVTNVVLDDLKKESAKLTHGLQDKISNTVEKETRVTLSETFRLLVQPWWEIYEPDYQKFLRGESVPDKYLKHDVLIAKRLTDKGLRLLDKGFLDEHVETIPRAFVMYAKLVNNFVYHETAELLCHGETAASSRPRVDWLISRAEECLTFGKDNKLRNEGIPWYEFLETAAVALIKFGDEKRGRQIIHDLFAGKTPGHEFEKPPKEWLIDRWNEYFPPKPDGTGNQDLLSLGPVAIPV